MNRLWIWVLAAGFYSFSLNAEGQAPKSKSAPPTNSVPRPAPEFLWSGVNGKVRRLRDVRGHPVVLVFAAERDKASFELRSKAQLKKSAAGSERPSGESQGELLVRIPAERFDPEGF